MNFSYHEKLLFLFNNVFHIYVYPLLALVLKPGKKSKSHLLVCNCD